MKKCKCTTPPRLEENDVIITKCGGCGNWIDKNLEHLDEEFKKLQHHKDTTVGLFSIDFDPKQLLRRFINSQSDACQLLVEDAEQLQKDWERWLNNENHFKNPFFQIKG